LIDGRQLGLEDVVEYRDDFGIAFHSAVLLLNLCREAGFEYLASIKAPAEPQESK